MKTPVLITPREAGGGAPATGPFGPYSKRVVRFLAAIPDLSLMDVGMVTQAWWAQDRVERAGAWVQLHRAVSQDDRYPILAAAALARRVALDAAGQYHWSDWGFWAAATDAGAGVAAGDRIGGHYAILVSPLQEVMPWLSLQDIEVETQAQVDVGGRVSGGVLQQAAE